MIFTTDDRFQALHDGDRTVVDATVTGDVDPATASQDFSTDDLAVFPVDGAADIQPGTVWRCAGQRSIARHGASALDTEVTVRLLVPQDFTGDATALLNQAMMRVALALAG